MPKLLYPPNDGVRGLPRPKADQGADAPRLSGRPPKDADVETDFLNRGLVFFLPRLCCLGRMSRSQKLFLNEPDAHAPEASPHHALTFPDSNLGSLPDCLVYRFLLYFLIIKA